MGSIRIIKCPPHELIIAERPLISRLIRSLIIGGSVGGVILGVGLFITGQSSFTGSLTTLQCTHQESLTCKMTVVDARGGLIDQAEVSPVQKVDIAPIVSSEQVCSGSEEDRKCETVKYYECPIRLHSPQTSLTVPISALTQRTSSLAEACPKQNAYSAQFERLISGEQKSGFWLEDTRIGDIFTPFKRDIAAYIPAVFLGLPALLCFLTNRHQRTVKFDNLRQTVELQTKDWFGNITTKTWSTKIQFLNKKQSSNSELGWEEIQSLKIIKQAESRRDSEDDYYTVYTYEVSLITNSGDSLVLLSECGNLERTEQIGEMIAKFLGVPLLKA